MALYKEYVPVVENNQATHIKFQISYNKDTYHWATGNTKQKGYQLTATPVTKSDMVESFTAFQGFYKIIFPVERQSKKRLATAIETFNNDKQTYLDYFKNQGFKFEN